MGYLGSGYFRPSLGFFFQGVWSKQRLTQDPVLIWFNIMVMVYGITIQHGNAASVLETLPSGSISDQLAYV